MPHYYEARQTSKFSPKEIKAILRGKEFSFVTASGIFSVNQVDKGTKTLVNYSEVDTNAKVLDLGCGYGVVGIVIKKCLPKTNVTMVDINERAVKLAKQNAEKNNVQVNIFSGNLFEQVKEEKFDTILVNPPYVAGRELCYKIIEESIKHLNYKGTLQLVARHNKGGAMLEKKMKEVFGNVETLAKKAGYRVYKATNS
ncbi:MAG: class I SAM-dependent methyltransferase [Candidatus Woesearchaeota archaeon]